MTSQRDIELAERTLGQGWRFIDADDPRLTRRQRAAVRELDVRPYARNIRSGYVLARREDGRYALPPYEHEGDIQYIGA